MVRWATSRQNLSSGFPRLQTLARKLKFRLYQAWIWYFTMSEQQRRWSDCASALLLFTNHRRQVFSRRAQIMLTRTCMQILCGWRVMSMFTKYHGETDSPSVDRRVVQFFVCGNLCRLLTDIFANSLDPRPLQSVEWDFKPRPHP